MADDNGTGGQNVLTSGFQADDDRRGKALAAASKPSPDTNVLLQGKTAVGDVDDTDDPKTKHALAITALQNSRKKYADTLAMKEPKKHHTRLSLLNAALGIAATALDPSRQAGLAYVNGVSQGQAAQDNERNQAAENAFKRRQQMGLAEAQNYNEDAARYFNEEQAAQGRADAKAKQEKDDQDAKDDAAAKAHDKLIGDIKADIPGYLNMIKPGNDDIIRHLGAHMLKNHIKSYGQYYGEAGYPNSQDDLNAVADNVLNSKAVKTPEQIMKEEKARQAKALADKAESDAAKAKIDAANEPKRIKDVADEIHARTGASKLQSQKLAQDLSWAPKDHVLKIAQAHATLDKTYKEIDEVSARTKKLRAANGSTVLGNLTPDQVKSLTKTNTLLSQTMREQEAQIKSADKWISDNTFGGKLLDPNDAKELARQRKIKANSQKYYHSLQAKAEALRHKLGVPLPDDDSGDE